MYASPRIPPSRTALKKPQSFVNFLDLSLLFCSALGLAALALTGTQGIVRAVLALAISGLGPGYSLTVALWNNDALAMEERLVLSLVFSISTMVLIVLIMSRLNVSITSVRLSLALAGVILAAVLSAAYRRLFGRVESSPAYRIKGAHYIVLAVVLTLALGTGLMIRPALTARPPAFYVTTLQLRQNGLPGYVSENRRLVVRLTINQGTAAPASYQVFARVGAHTLVDKTIRVKHQWSTVVVLPTRTRGFHRAMFWLATGHSPRPYRTLWLSYHVVPPASNP
ncbi:MAG: DUF1616 domain-containing protein [Firmicutes bacterium]|nr:DUF1616 domain-containing protein [Bacillota bacterium]